MSYNIQLFRVATKIRAQALQTEDFFEDDHNLAPFSAEQIQQLKERLEKYEYHLAGKNEHGLVFVHAEYGEALLTDRGLYFSTSSDFEAVFEVGLTASEFTDTGEFAKYDPQIGAWEKF